MADEMEEGVVKCPYCGYVTEPWYESFSNASDGAEETMECGGCEKDFIALVEFSFTVSTFKIKNKEGEHND